MNDHTLDLNLRRGRRYRATTRSGTHTGEYLGMETMFDDRSILLREGGTTGSIAVATITAIRPARAA
ncbi:MAG: hypothetical protein R3290_13210 [Acidimicrobiia bacterium]|nr:hypothetical protein [Acidimicrobiia bacterium]